MKLRSEFSRFSDGTCNFAGLFENRYELFKMALWKKCSFVLFFDKFSFTPSKSLNGRAF